MTKFAVENREDELSKWLLLEYENCSRIWDGEITFFGIPDSFKGMEKLGKIHHESCKSLLKGKNVIVLDPKADTTLTVADVKDADYIVAGGILGSGEPAGRTNAEITKDSGFEARNLGQLQLSIDSTAFVVKAATLGMEPQSIELTSEVEIEISPEESTIIPYAYPIIESQLLITPGLIELLKESKDETQNG